MKMYFPDEVAITRITRDTTFRTETEGTTIVSDAYIEEDDRITYGPDGQPLRPARRVFLPYNTAIGEGDLLRVIKLHGLTITEDARKVIGVSRVGAFVGSHLEVIVGNR